MSSSSIIACWAAFEDICRLFLSVTSFLSLGPRNPTVLQGCLCLEFGLKVKKIIFSFSALSVSTIGLNDSSALLFASVGAETSVISSSYPLAPALSAIPFVLIQQVLKTSSAWSTPGYFFIYSPKQATHRSLPYDADSTVCTVSAHPHLLISAAYMQASSPSAVSGMQEFQPGASLPRDDALLQRNRIISCSFGRCARFPLIIPAIFSEGNRSI